MSTLGHVYTQKFIRPWLLRILEISHWLRVSWTLALGLHEGNFGLQPITFSMDEKSAWNPTWQV